MPKRKKVYNTGTHLCKHSRPNIYLYLSIIILVQNIRKTESNNQTILDFLKSRNKKK